MAFVAGNSAGTSTIAAVACYGLPLGAIAVLALLLAYGRSLVVPPALMERTDAAIERFLALRDRLQIRMARMRSRAPRRAA
jgi:hypothetical protein